jgi:hypothetical protein
VARPSGRPPTARQPVALEAALHAPRKSSASPHPGIAYPAAASANAITGDGQPLRSNVVPANPDERPVHSSFPISAKCRLSPLSFHL